MVYIMIIVEHNLIILCCDTIPHLLGMLVVSGRISLHVELAVKHLLWWQLCLFETFLFIRLLFSTLFVEKMRAVPTYVVEDDRDVFRYLVL